MTSARVRPASIADRSSGGRPWWILAAALGPIACEPAALVQPLLDGGVGGATTSSTTTTGTGAVGTGAGTTGTGAFGTGGGSTACGFAAPTDFALPPGFHGPTSGAPPFADVTGSELCTSGANIPSFVLADMNGDGRPDMLVTQSCGTSLGIASWSVYLNTGSGFATAATPFALPAGYAGSAPPFPTTSASELCTGGANAPAYALIDMDADAKPDLLVTRSCTDTTVGTGRWLVYKNTGSGFAATATAYALPPGYGALPFTSLGSLASCAGSTGSPGFVLADMNGDGKPDLLVTQSCTDAAVGTTSWLLYPSTGAGFAQTATTLTLPGGYTAPTPVFASIQGTLSCTGADAPQFTLADMNADGRPSLVLTRLCNNTAIGTSSWLVYKNTAAGFSGSPINWTLPAGFSGQANGTPAVPFGDFTGTLACTGANAPEFGAVDVNGDGRLDLLVTQRCNDTSVGTTRWLAYEGTGTGFATAPTAVALPAGYTAGTTGAPPAFGAVSGALTCVGGADVPEFALVPIRSTLLPDLVVTRRCNDATTGSTTWLVDASSCH
jgi:hypothetical protein